MNRYMVYFFASMLKKAFKIGKRMVGIGYPCFTIAEISANHNQDYQTSAAMVKTFIEAGADAIKLQTYTADELTIDCDKGMFAIPKDNQFVGPKSLYELYKGSYMPWEFQAKLKKIADEAGVPLFSTPQSIESVDFLESKLHVDAYKVASFEISHFELLKRMAKTKKPVILSNGGASIREIVEAIEFLENEGAEKIVVLQCSSGYPALPEQMNLQNMSVIQKMFGVPVGLSDHTLGIGVAVAGVALGACVVEKHVTLNKNDKGPDHRFSMEPAEWSLMVKSIRQAEAAVNAGMSFEISTGPALQNKRYTRSVYVVEDIKKGEKLNKKNLRVIRPGEGLHPREFEYILGMMVKRDVKRGTPMSWDLIK